MYVCTECTNKTPCTCEEGEIRAIACCGKEGLKRIFIAEWREYISGDDLYSDAIGEPYKGFETYMQTPMSNPIRPHTAEEIRKIKEDHDRRLIDTL